MSNAPALTLDLTRSRWPELENKPAFDKRVNNRVAAAVAFIFTALSAGGAVAIGLALTATAAVIIGSFATCGVIAVVTLVLGVILVVRKEFWNDPAYRLEQEQRLAHHFVENNLSLAQLTAQDTHHLIDNVDLNILLRQQLTKTPLHTFVARHGSANLLRVADDALKSEMAAKFDANVPLASIDLVSPFVDQAALFQRLLAELPQGYVALSSRYPALVQRADADALSRHFFACDMANGLSWMDISARNSRRDIWPTDPAIFERYKREFSLFAATTEEGWLSLHARHSTDYAYLQLDPALIATNILSRENPALSFEEFVARNGTEVLATLPDSSVHKRLRAQFATKPYGEMVHSTLAAARTHLGINDAFISAVMSQEVLSLTLLQLLAKHGTALSDVLWTPANKVLLQQNFAAEKASITPRQLVDLRPVWESFGALWLIEFVERTAAEPISSLMRDYPALRGTLQGPAITARLVREAKTVPSLAAFRALFADRPFTWGILPSNHPEVLRLSLNAVDTYLGASPDRDYAEAHCPSIRALIDKARTGDSEALRKKMTEDDRSNRQYREKETTIRASYADRKGSVRSRCEERISTKRSQQDSIRYRYQSLISAKSAEIAGHERVLETLAAFAREEAELKRQKSALAAAIAQTDAELQRLPSPERVAAEQARLRPLIDKCDRHLATLDVALRVKRGVPVTGLAGVAEQRNAIAELEGQRSEEETRRNRYQRELDAAQATPAKAAELRGRRDQLTRQLHTLPERPTTTLSATLFTLGTLGVAALKASAEAERSRLQEAQRREEAECESHIASLNAGKETEIAALDREESYALSLERSSLKVALEGSDEVYRAAQESLTRTLREDLANLKTRI